MRFIDRLAVIALVLLPGHVAAQAFDGTYDGRMTCGLLSHLERGLKTPFRMTVTGAEAAYEREILNRGAPTGLYERGAGSVSASGDVLLAGKGAGPGYSFDGEYRGRLRPEKTGRLTGTQRWRIQNWAPDERSCQIEPSGAPKS